MLPISVASHCDLLIPMRETFAGIIESTEFADPEIPVIDNVTALPLTKAADVKHALIEQLTSPVLFEESLRYLASQQYKRFVECGPGKSLIELAKRVVSDIELLGFDDAALLHSVAAL
jgi:[acyl-carrier-protein] S-malonyltransferase